MIARIGLSLLSGLLLGAGLAVSGMVDPARVRAFLDVTGAWDPTLAFVMVGAILPMALAWLLVRTRAAPLADDYFHVPATTLMDKPLLVGGAIFGIGWGLAGLCPGPALAALALHPIPASIFVLAMMLGAALHRIGFAAPAPARATN